VSLFGFLGKVATGFLAGGPVGAVVGAASSLIKPSSGPGKALVNIASAGQALAVPPAARLSSPQISSPPLIDSTKTIGLKFGPLTIGTQTQYSSPALPVAGGAYNVVGCPVGHHLNKTGYYTKHGYVAKGTVCVKNRRRNPLNPRALSRSMSRIHSAKKAAHFLDRIHIGACRTRKGPSAPVHHRKR
jgi:hypothetical protein